ncbi:hypothetical protein AXE80_01835 [Wenyingzhuangia fucanilytica]|uniref:DUF547 domain-containing protein n=1 Tax=Wenyingzhuangia fucanilytica TaxID=1790137 RepID=A0A1B1Y2X2_9FLAO|nr:DUF547 domain-containing protein [Wenyingzhuangia fucanilytica]ANW95111.1 hypothetical protein AXE80_01835 [Wenyingzhuangia fucanilytica]
MKQIILLFILFISFTSFSQSTLWNQLLQKHVDQKGWVNYDGFKNDNIKLNQYLSYLANTQPDDHWSDSKQKAFWINAYNAYTIKLILKHYPLKSILEIKKDDKNAWEIPFVKIGSKTYTLNDVEHKILRKKYKDPRIHVGVNCASISCPQLPNIAFTEKNIDSLLTTQMNSFINDSNRNNISLNKVELSQIFNWFKDDFTQQTDLITFINQYSNITINNGATIDYKEYNWNLNNQK